MTGTEAPILTPRLVLLTVIFLVGSMLTVSLVCRELGYLSTLHEIKQLLGLTATNDSWLYMNKAISWWHAHPAEDLYGTLFFRDHVQFFYPLTSLLPILGLQALGLESHESLTILNMIFWILGVTVLGWFARILAMDSRLVAPRSRTSRLAPLVGAMAAVCFYPFLKGFSLGQIQVWLDLAFFTACLAYARGYCAAAGCLMGLSALVKPQMSLFLLWGLLRKEKRFIAGGVLMAVIGIAIALCLFKPAQLVGYRGVLAFIADHGEAYFANQSFNGLANRLAHDPSNTVWSDTDYPPYRPFVAWTTRTAGLLLIVTGLFWKWKDAKTYRVNSFAAAGICFTAASPIAWEHHYAVLLPGFLIAYMGLLSDARGVSRTRAWYLAAIYIVCANLLNPLNVAAATPFNFVQSYLLIGALCLLQQLMLRPLVLGPPSPPQGLQ